MKNHLKYPHCVHSSVKFGEKLLTIKSADDIIHSLLHQQFSEMNKKHVFNVRISHELKQIWDMFIHKVRLSW